MKITVVRVKNKSGLYLTKQREQLNFDFSFDVLLLKSLITDYKYSYPSLNTHSVPFSDLFQASGFLKCEESSR